MSYDKMSSIPQAVEEAILAMQVEIEREYATGMFGDYGLAVTRALRAAITTAIKDAAAGCEECEQREQERRDSEDGMRNAAEIAGLE